MRKDLFTQLKIILNELDISFQPKKYFKMSNDELKSLIVKYNDEIEDREENLDYKIYRAI